MHRLIARVLCAFLAVTLIGCSQTHFEDPIFQISNKQLGPEERAAAMKQAEAEHRDDPKRIAALYDVLYNRGSADLRKLAADQLAAYDEAAFRKNLANRITLLDNEEVLAHALDIVAAKGWSDITPAIVRSWTRPEHGVPDAQRIERGYLQKLNPGRAPEAVVLDTFTSETVNPQERAAAWELLNRLSPPDQVADLLGKSPDVSPMIADLKACWRDLHTVPRTREGLLWLMYLRDPARRPYWDAAATKVARLSVAQLKGLELRHLPVLIYADDASLSLDRNALLGEVTRTVNASEHHLKSATFDGQYTAYPQQLADWRDDLSWADALTIRTLLRAVQQPDIIAELFKQADRDHNDTTTEYGGVLRADVPEDQPGGPGTRIVAALHLPEIRKHDMKFYPPQDMIDQLYTGLTHYHFHAQNLVGDDLAGPGKGDIDFANHMNSNCLVFSFAGKDALNVDYYQRGGVVIDLCTLKR